jgi:hypothetical protein
MRASVGFRVGPVYLGTGNLLKSSRRRRRGPGLLGILLVYPVIGMWLLLKYMVLAVCWWFPLYTWRGIVWTVRQVRGMAARGPQDRRGGPVGGGA